MNQTRHAAASCAAAGAMATSGRRRCGLLATLFLATVTAALASQPAALAAPPAPDPLRFAFTDLGTFGGSASRAYDINDKGQVVGWAAAARAPVQEYDFRTKGWVTSGAWSAPNAFLYDSKHDLMVNLGRPGEASEAWSINDSTRIVGSVGSADNLKRAFRSHKGPLDENGEELGFLSGAVRASHAWGINDRNQVVGVSYDQQGYAGFLYDHDRMTSLGPLLGAPSHTRAINRDGIVVGDSFYDANHTGPIHAYSKDTRTGRVTDLGVLASTLYGTNHGATYPMLSHAWDINDDAQIVGWSYVDQPPGTYGAVHHAFLYEGGRMRDLGTLPGAPYSEAYGINDDGVAVGQSGVRAVMFVGGQVLDLNTLLDEPLPAGWRLTYARAINDRGQIVGYGVDALGNDRAFLLDPVGLKWGGEGLGAADLDPEVQELLALTGTFSPHAIPAPIPETVPEPAAAGILLACAALAAGRRRRPRV